MSVVVISDELAQKALDTLCELMDLNAESTRANYRRGWAASKIYELFQTQQRFSPEEIERRGAQSQASRAVRDLFNLTPEQLLRYQRDMIAAES